MNTNGDLAQTELARQMLDAALAYMVKLGFGDDQITEIIWARLDAARDATRHPRVAEPAG